MGNCLVTKLKESVQNSELLKIGEAKLAISPDSNIELGYNVAGDTCTIINSDGTSRNVTIADAGSGVGTVLSLNTGDENIIIKKYETILFKVLNSNSIQFTELFYSPIQEFRCISNQLKTLFRVTDLYKWDSLRVFTMDNYPYFTGTLAELASHPNASNINVVSINECPVSGYLNDIVSAMTSLSILNIRYCQNITVTRSALNALQAQGCSVNYTQTVVEDV